MEQTQIAALLGVVEGLTEFLPVSSTGHLIVFGKLFNFDSKYSETFEIFIQAGAVLAVVVLFFRRFTDLLSLEFNVQNFRGLSGIAKLGVGCLPAFVVGFLTHHYIKEHLFSTSVVAYSLIIGGVVFLVLPDNDSKASVRSLDRISFLQAFKIGIIQLLALCPGVSRSGATIVGGMLFGLTKEVATEFSFLLAVPVLFAAVAYDLLKNIKFLTATDIPIFSIGILVSFLTALIAIRTFITLVSKYSFKPWGFYRIFMGVCILYYFSSF